MVKITREKALNLWNVLQKLSEVKGSIPWINFVARNKMTLHDEIHVIEDVISKRQAPEGYFEYDTKLQEIIKKYAVKNEDGNYIVKNQKYVFKPEEEDIVNNLKDELDNEYKNVLDEHKKNIDDFNKFMTEDLILLSLIKIKIGSLPENDLTPNQFELFVELNLIIIE